jgi:hypothetical protein
MRARAIQIPSNNSFSSALVTWMPYKPPQFVHTAWNKRDFQVVGSPNSARQGTLAWSGE